MYDPYIGMISAILCRVHTDLEKSLNLTLVLENSWNLKKVPFVLEFCKIALENVKLSLKIIKYIYSFRFFWINITVGKHTPCLLSFVYTSYIRYGVQAVPNFGKHASLYSYHKDKKYVYAIICSVILLSCNSNAS